MTAHPLQIPWSSAGAPPPPAPAAHLAAAGLDTPALQAAGLAVLGHFRQGDPLATLAAAGGGGPSHGTALDFLGTLRWLDGTPPLGHAHYNLAPLGRAKKNAKSLDLVLMALVMVLRDAVGGSQVFLLASDEEQAGDAPDLAKTRPGATPPRGPRLAVREEGGLATGGMGRCGGDPPLVARGSGFKTYTLCGF